MLRHLLFCRTFVLIQSRWKNISSHHSQVTRSLDNTCTQLRKVEIEAEKQYVHRERGLVPL